MDRMSPLDATFLHLEDGVTHMHIASCALFEGPAPAYDDLVSLLHRKLPRIPRYRQKVRFVPGAIGRPVWVDDAHFRLDYHVRHTALPPPGGQEALANLMGRLMSQQLDRNRPLWETWMVEGLNDEFGPASWALISKVHHCMVDGVSGTDLMAVLLDASPHAVAPDVEEWRPAPEPTDADLVRDAFGDAVGNPAEMARWVRRGLRRPRRLLDDARQVVDGVRSLGAQLRPNVPLPIEGTIGPHRRWAWARASIAEVKMVRSALGGTVNDVVLTAITGGFRELLLARGEELDGVSVHTLVPVSVRSRDDHSPNNQVSAMIAQLPVGIADPVERLGAIRTQMADLKESHQAVAGSALVNMAGFAPPALLSAGLRTAYSMMRRMPQRSVNTVTTNVPGPQVPLYACGCEMLDYFPFVPLGQGMRTGVAILSYNGRIGFGVTGDWDTIPDVDVLARGIRDGIDELLTASAAAEAPVHPTSARGGGRARLRA